MAPFKDLYAPQVTTFKDADPGLGETNSEKGSEIIHSSIQNRVGAAEAVKKLALTGCYSRNTKHTECQAGAPVRSNRSILGSSKHLKKSRVKPDLPTIYKGRKILPIVDQKFKIIADQLTKVIPKTPEPYLQKQYQVDAKAVPKPVLSARKLVGKHPGQVQDFQKVVEERKKARELYARGIPELVSSVMYKKKVVNNNGEPVKARPPIDSQ